MLHQFRRGSSHYGKQNLHSTRSGEVPVITVNRTCIPPVQERFLSLRLTEFVFHQVRKGSSHNGKQNLYSTSSGEVPLITVNRICVSPSQELVPLVQERFLSLQLTEQLTRSGEVNRTYTSPVQERKNKEKANRLWEVPLIMVNRIWIPPGQERFLSLR